MLTVLVIQLKSLLIVRDEIEKGEGHDVTVPRKEIQKVSTQKTVVLSAVVALNLLNLLFYSFVSVWFLYVIHTDGEWHPLN